MQRTQMLLLRCCRVIDSSPLMFNLVQRPLTSQTDDADSWLRDGLGQTPLLTCELWFTSHQRHTAQHGYTTCVRRYIPKTLPKCTHEYVCTRAHTFTHDHRYTYTPNEKRLNNCLVFSLECLEKIQSETNVYLN